MARRYFRRWPREVVQPKWSSVLKKSLTAASRAEEIRQNGWACVAKWEQEMAEVSSPELRPGAAHRREKIKASYDEVVAIGRCVREAYRPYLKDLQDIQHALASDLAPQVVDAAASAIAKAKADGAALNERLDTLIAKLDEVSGSMSAAGTPTSPSAPVSPSGQASQPE